MSDLHGEIMNIPCIERAECFDGSREKPMAYRLGHRDARHAAAELALGAEERAYASGRADEREESARLLETLKVIRRHTADAELYDIADAAIAAYEGTDSGGTGAREGARE